MAVTTDSRCIRRSRRHVGLCWIAGLRTAQHHFACRCSWVAIGRASLNRLEHGRHVTPSRNNFSLGIPIYLQQGAAHEPT
jgi:hypothetical protein